jgi:hypothetical protein
LAFAGARIGTAILGDIETNAFQLFRRIEVAAPLPDGDGDMDAAGLRRNTHLLAAAPGNRADIGVGKALALEHLVACRFQLFDRVGNLEIQHARRLVKALIVFGQLEDASAIGALALEYGARIMQPMRQHVKLGLLPGHEFTVEPDFTVQLIKGSCCHGVILRRQCAIAIVD